jgi:hypothetical protein
VLLGPQLPVEVLLELDTGASCLPRVAVGDIAVLRPDGAVNPARWLLPAAIVLLGAALLGRRRGARR